MPQVVASEQVFLLERNVKHRIWVVRVFLEMVGTAHHRVLLVFHHTRRGPNDTAGGANDPKLEEAIVGHAKAHRSGAKPMFETVVHRLHEEPFFRFRTLRKSRTRQIAVVPEQSLLLMSNEKN